MYFCHEKKKRSPVSHRRPYLLYQMWNTGTPCHPLWRLVAINCLMFHARTGNISPMRGVSDDVCFRKLFFPKAHTNSRRTKFTFTWERFASHAYECTRNVFPIFFFPPGQPVHPQLFRDRVRPTRSYARRLRQNIYALKCALSRFRSENERIKMGRKYYGRIDCIFIAWMACVRVQNNDKNFSLFIVCI